MSDENGLVVCDELLSIVLSVQREFIVSQDAVSAIRMLNQAVTSITGSSAAFLCHLEDDSEGLTRLKLFDAVHGTSDSRSLGRKLGFYSAGLPLTDIPLPVTEVLKSGIIKYLNDPEEIRAAGLMPGIEECQSWAAIPLAPGGNTIGVMIIADKQGGYDTEMLEKLRPLFRVAGHFLLAYREREESYQVEKSHAFYRNLYDSLLEHSLDCIVSMTSDGNVVEWNPAAEATFGWTRDEVMGRTLSEMIVPHGMRKAHGDGLAKYLETGEGPVIDQRIEVPALRKDGVEIPVELAIMASQLDKGVLFTAHIRDVTAARAFKNAIQEARDAAEASNKAKTNFVATVSHEIRTPINAIMGAMGLLESLDLDSRNRAILNTAKHSAEALLSLVNDVLDFARIESGKLDIELAPVRLSEMCDGVTQLFTNRAQSGGTKLASVIHQGLNGELLLDSGKLRQVLLNLVGNAVKFSEKGSVRLDVGLENGMLKFEIRDTGVGISESDQKELFKEFVQVGTRRVSGGTGLGLNISRRLVEFMGGKIGVASVPGGGSNFWFTLPFDSEASQDPGIEAEGKTILLINEGNFYIRAIADQLRALGINVRVARDFSRAREMLYQGSPVSLVVLPLEEGSGDYSIDAVRAITRVCQEAHIPALAMSEKANATDELLGHSIGVAAIIDAPLLHEDIKAIISSADSGPQDVEKTWSMRMDVSAPGKKFIRVLLAEDSQANSLVMSELLRRAGYEVDVVGDGKEAVTAVKTLPYDVVLMDVDMPIMDGLDATRAIRKLGGEMAKIPIIALTAHVVTGFKEVVLKSGMDDYLSKPVDNKLMNQMIDLWASKRKEGMAPPDNDGLVDDSVLQQLAIDTSEEMVPQMLKVFINELTMRSERIADAIKHRDLSALAKEAHALKSSSATFGAAAIAEHARKMDDAAREGREELALKSAKLVLSLIEPTVNSLNSRIEG